MTRTAITVDGRTYGFVCLSSSEELEGYWDQWSALVASDSQRTIFSSPEFFRAVCKARPDSGEPHVVFVRRAGEVVACAPMVVSRQTIKRVPCRTLKFYMRRADCVAPRDRRGIAEALACYWREISSQWDVLALEELPDSSETLQVLEAAAANWHDCRSLPRGPTDTESFLVTDGSWEDYMGGRTSHFRRRWNRIHRGADNLSFVTVLGASDSDSALQDIFALEKRSWKVTGGSRLTDDERAMFLELARTTGGDVTYQVKFIEAKGEKIAGLLSYLHFDRVYLFLTFFDQRYDKVAPGKLVMGASIEEAFRDLAIREVSFVGSYATAKVWTSSTRDYRSIRIYGRSMAARLAYLTDRWKHAKAGLKPRLGKS